MAKIVDAVFKGISEESYDFEVFSTDTVFPDVGAVYIFAQYDPGFDCHFYEILYVGETDSLIDRIPPRNQTDSVNYWNVNGYCVNAICVHLDADESSRLSKQEDLVKLIGTSVHLTDHYILEHKRFKR